MCLQENGKVYNITVFLMAFFGISTENAAKVVFSPKVAKQLGLIIKYITLTKVTRYTTRILYDDVCVCTGKNFPGK